MPISKLQLEGFRNYAKIEIDFQIPQTTYLVGDNGSGKTSILEAIFILALGKSFRVKDSENLIQWNQEFARIKGQTSNENKSSELEVFFGTSPQPKQVWKINGSKVALKNWLGRIKIVLFQPDDLNILYLSPDLRRKYLDYCCLQLFPGYLNSLKNYQKIRQHRNALLQNIKNKSARIEDLAIWDEKMAQEGAFITKSRFDLTEKLAAKLTEKYQSISSQNEAISLTYRHCLTAKMSNNTNNLPPSEYEILLALQSNHERDILSGHSSIGPHRDDLEIKLRDKPLDLHASRGEIRSLMLALKLCELDLYQADNFTEILILLDDVFSELDEIRQKQLLLAVKGFQTIITTTPDHLYAHQKWLDNCQAQIIRIDRGQIVQ